MLSLFSNKAVLSPAHTSMEMADKAQDAIDSMNGENRRSTRVMLLACWLSGLSFLLMVIQLLLRWIDTPERARDLVLGYHCAFDVRTFIVFKKSSAIHDTRAHIHTHTEKLFFSACAPPWEEKKSFQRVKSAFLEE